MRKKMVISYVELENQVGDIITKAMGKCAFFQVVPKKHLYPSLKGYAEM